MNTRRIVILIVVLVVVALGLVLYAASPSLIEVFRSLHGG